MKLYLISGRVPGEDDDTATVIVAVDEKAALAAFRAEAQDGYSAEDLEGIRQEYGGEDLYVVVTERVGDFITHDTMRVAPWLALSTTTPL